MCYCNQLDHQPRDEYEFVVVDIMPHMGRLSLSWEHYLTIYISHIRSIHQGSVTHAHTSFIWLLIQLSWLINQDKRSPEEQIITGYRFILGEDLLRLNSAQRRGTWFSTEVKEIAQEQGSHLPRPPTSRGISDQRDQRSNQTSEKNNATDRLSGTETSAFIAKLRGDLALRFTTKLLGLD